MTTACLKTVVVGVSKGKLPVRYAPTKPLCQLNFM